MLRKAISRRVAASNGAVVWAKDMMGYFSGLFCRVLTLCSGFRIA